jgi:hypothetical protein
MAAVGYVSDVTGQKMAVGARHRLSLEIAFRPKKASSKRLDDSLYAMLWCEINNCLGPTRSFHFRHANTFSKVIEINLDPDIRAKHTGVAEDSRPQETSLA